MIFQNRLHMCIYINVILHGNGIDAISRIVCGEYSASEIVWLKQQWFKFAFVLQASEKQSVGLKFLESLKDELLDKYDYNKDD